MMTKRITESTRQILAMMALPVLVSLASPAAAGNTTHDNPCGSLTEMGIDIINNHSHYDWNVVFITTAINEAFGISYNAGAVKYLSDDNQWVDTGVGDYRSTKIYTVPVPAYERAMIAFCADRSRQNYRIEGHLFFTPVNPALVHGIPDGNVLFSGENGTTSYFNNGFTPYVNYNRDNGYLKYGSLEICPSDPECKIP
jgi:hypothetical protein